MAKYKPQHARLLFIDRRLREGAYPNCTSLAREWEVSAKTIQRDLDYLRYQLDAPLAYSPAHRGYWYTEDQYQLPAISIRESDLFGLYLAEKLLNQYEGTPIHASLVSVFRKIEDSLPEKIALDPTVDQSRFTVFPPFSTSIDPGVWDTVMQGLRTSERLEITYRRPGEQAQLRHIDPYHGVRFEGDWYVVAHCHLRKSIRTFSLARIHSATATGRHFTIPEDFDFHRLVGSHFGVHWGKGETTVTIRFAARVADLIRERIWHPSQRMTEEGDGSLRLTLTVSHLLELKRWILSWGDEALVLAPPEFVADMQGTTAAMTANYRECAQPDAASDILTRTDPSSDSKPTPGV